MILLALAIVPLAFYCARIVVEIERVERMFQRDMEEV